MLNGFNKRHCVGLPYSAKFKFLLPTVVPAVGVLLSHTAGQRAVLGTRFNSAAASHGVEIKCSPMGVLVYRDFGGVSSGYTK